MEFQPKSPPREFPVGYPDRPIILKDCGRLYLNQDEQITFTTKDGKEYDVCRKNWGFYATPSTNGRLKKFGFKTVLVNSSTGLYYLWLVDEQKISEFEVYAKNELHEVVCWLDDERVLSYFEGTNFSVRCICGSYHHEKIATYREPPAGEVRFNEQLREYFREIYRCKFCGHFTGKTELDIHDIYDSHYADSTYGDNLQTTFERIVNLPPEGSDNFARVEFVKKIADELLSSNNSTSILDVGSGLCVFLHLVKNITDWNCTALDPDHRQFSHAQEFVGVNAIHGDFMQDLDELKNYEIITFNKVLEHVTNPIEMLRKAKGLLALGGFVYIELPDGTMAKEDSLQREEFYIEHLHVFSIASVAVLAEQAGFVVREIQRVIEPSSKYTIRAILMAD